MGPNLLTERLRQPGAVDLFEEFLDGCERILERSITPTDLLADRSFFQLVCQLGDAAGYPPEDVRSWAQYVDAQATGARNKAQVSCS